MKWFMLWMAIAITIGMFVVCAAEPKQWPWPMPQPPNGPVPTLAAEVDVLLVIYHGNRLPSEEFLLKIQRKVREAVGCMRVITYPEGYVPMLIHKDKVDDVRKLLGPWCLRVSPSIEDNPDWPVLDRIPQLENIAQE